MSRYFRLAGGFLLIFLTLAPAFMDTAVHAAEPQGVSLAPFLKNLTISSSDTSKSYSLEVTNNAKYSRQFHLSTLDFGSLDETGGIAFVGDTARQNTKYGLAHWIQIDKPDFTLEAGKSMIITVSVVNDQFLAPGGHYASIIIRVNTPDKSGSNQVNIKQKLSTLLFLIKTGGEHYDLHLDEIKHNGNLIKLPDQANLRFQNTGNVQVVPRGLVSVTGLGGIVLKRGAINQQSSYALPETFRQFSVDLASVNKDKFRFGLFNSYTIRVDYRYDGYDKYATASQTIRLLNKPVAAAIFALGIIILAAAAVYYKKYRPKRK